MSRLRSTYEVFKKMCVSSAPAVFLGTQIYAGEFYHEGEIAHSLMYQNTPVNKSSGPNCMVLHLPSAEVMAEDNVVDVGDKGHDFIKDVISASRPRNRSALGGSVLTASAAGDHVEVFDKGIYTVVLASRPALVLKALKDVPERKRPKLPHGILRFYTEHFKGWPLALCCFDSADHSRATPLFWWYRPLHPEYLFVPGVDAHNGKAPDLSAEVDYDHQIVFGSVRDFKSFLRPNRHQGFNTVSQHYKKNFEGSFLDKVWPKHAKFGQVEGSFLNGDFFVRVDQLGAITLKVERGLLSEIASRQSA